ncbi:hypothetical protein [Photobacterium sp. SP02]
MSQIIFVTIEAHFCMPHTRALIASDVAQLVQVFETQENGGMSS